MTNRKVINGSVQLPPTAPPVMQTVKLLVDRVVAGSVRSREETVTVPQQTAAQWIEAREAEAVVETSGPVLDVIQDTSMPEQSRARSARKKAE